MSTFLPEISASKVAALIGMNPYQPNKEAMYDLLCKHTPTKLRIATLEARENRTPLPKLKSKILNSWEVKSIVSAGVKACVGQTDISDTLTDVEGQARMALNLRHAELTPEVRDLMVAEVRGAVQRQRGNENENAILNTYETDQNVVVEERNTATFRKTYPTYKLVGRTDGYVAAHNRIVDSKARTRWWPAVPIYDEIQLRTYMELSGCTESELVESFPDGRTRHTRYANDAEKWITIETGIRDAVARMTSAVNDEKLLLDIIFANTVSM